MTELFDTHVDFYSCQIAFSGFKETNSTRGRPILITSNGFMNAKATKKNSLSLVAFQSLGSVSVCIDSTSEAVPATHLGQELACKSHTRTATGLRRRSRNSCN